MDSMKLLDKESLKYPRNGWKVSGQGWRDVWSTIQPKLLEMHSDLEFRQRTGLESLLERRWFRGVWILQEVANAAQAVVACGGKSVSARMFPIVTYLLGIKPEAHCQSVLDIMPGSSRGQSWWSQKRDLHTLLVKFGESEATDPRDHIRALLGISSDAQDGALLQAEAEGDVVKDTIAFLLHIPELREIKTSPGHWTIPRFFENIHSLSSAALVWAQYTNSILVAPILLARDDIDVNFKDKDGQTVLSRAIHGNQEWIISLLLVRDDLDVNWKDGIGETVLHTAVAEGRKERVALLLGRDDIDVNLQDGSDETALHTATDKGRTEIAKLLLTRADINVNLKNEKGETALNKAVGERKTDMVKLLLMRDETKMNLKNEKWDELLWIMPREERIEMIKLIFGHPTIIAELRGMDYIELHRLRRREVDGGEKKIIRLLESLCSEKGIDSVS